MTLAGSANLALAKDNVRKHVAKGWKKAYYEQIAFDLIGILRLVVPEDRLDEACFYAAMKLRRTITVKNEKWKSLLSQDSQIESLISSVLSEVVETIEHRPKPLRDLSCSSGSKFPNKNGFVPWVMYRNRHPVSDVPGVYLLAQYETEIPSAVDPFDCHVIDIGMGFGQTIRERLDGFQKTAHIAMKNVNYKNCTTKYSGWTYLSQFVTSYRQLLNFDGLYASWISLPEWPESDIKELENWLLVHYRRHWKAPPKINRQGLKELNKDFSHLFPLPLVK